MKLSVVFSHETWCVRREIDLSVWGSAPTKKQAKRLCNLLNDLVVPEPNEYGRVNTERDVINARVARTIETFRLQEGLDYKQVLGWDVNDSMVDWFKRSLNLSPYEAPNA